MRHAVEYHGI